MSGIKIPYALDANQNRIFAKDIANTGFQSPLKCSGNGCEAILKFVKGYKRESYGKTQFIPSFFRLEKGFDHFDFCKFKTSGNDVLNVKSSDADVKSALLRGEDLFRIHILETEDKKILDGREGVFSVNPPSDTTKREYKPRGKKSTYVKTINSLLDIYQYGLSNPKKRNEIMLLVNGKKVLWIDFFFSTSHLGALRRKIIKEGMVKAAVISTVNVIGFPNLKLGGFRFIECYPLLHKNGRGTFATIKLTKSMNSNVFSCNQRVLYYGTFSIPTTKELLIPQFTGNEIRTIVRSGEQVIEF